jgi:signal transduction histidine kinase
MPELNEPERKETPSRHDRDRILIEAGLALASELDLDVVLQRIVALAVSITDATYGALGVVDENGNIERFLTEGISAEQREAIGDPPVGRGLLGLLIREGHAIRVDDIASDERAVGFPPEHPRMTSFLGAPVRALGRIFGNIYLTDKRLSGQFTREDEEALTVLATQAGVAIENARLWDETQRAARELRRLEVLEERERIAKELHDGVIQSLFAVGMGLQGILGLVREESANAQIENAVEEIDRTIRDLRNYIFGLRPGILADRQLDQALKELGEEFQERTDVLTIVDVDSTVAAELASQATDIVQLTREALSNVGRHAGATSCRVSLKRTSSGALLEVDDDGSGFDMASPRSGMGLRNLEERVRGMGGDLSIQSRPGDGTTIRAMLPL